MIKLKLYYLSLYFGTFPMKNYASRENVRVELDESRPKIPTLF